jgi:hypothetical protein
MEDSFPQKVRSTPIQINPAAGKQRERLQLRSWKAPSISGQFPKSSQNAKKKWILLESCSSAKPEFRLQLSDVAGGSC